MMYDVWCIAYDVRCNVYDVGCTTYDLRCMMYEVWKSLAGVSHRQNFEMNVDQSRHMDMIDGHHETPVLQINKVASLTQQAHCARPRASVHKPEDRESPGDRSTKSC